MHFESSFLTPQSEVSIKKMNHWGSLGTPFVFIIDFELNKPIVLKITDAKRNGIFFEINTAAKNFKKKKAVLDKYSISFDKYKCAFNKVMHEIHQGNTYLLNLTFPTKINTALTIREIYNYSYAKYKLLFMNEFVVFSPETFIRINDGIVSSHPMKGTIDASIKDAERVILNDEKEIAEHNTIVDLIRNDLSLVSKNVRVEKFRYIDKIITNGKPLLQVSSKITGELCDNYCEKIGNIVFGMLPAGSISGAPKKKTVEIIKDVEGVARGYFTGIFGVFDGRNLDSAVMIRFIENSFDGLAFRSGGGITHMSNAETEYQELIDKVYVPFG